MFLVPSVSRPITADESFSARECTLGTGRFGFFGYVSLSSQIVFLVLDASYVFQF